MAGRIFKEPEGGWRAWAFVLIACYFFVETAFFREGISERLVYLAFGLAVLGFGLAELAPRGRTGLASALRVAGVALMVLTLAARVLQLTVLAG